MPKNPLISSRVSSMSTSNKDHEEDVHTSSYEAVLRMPISYAEDISDGQSLGIFFNILLRWRGSLYKLLWADLVIYVVAYYVLNITYRLALNPDQRRIFEKLVYFCDNMKSNIPLPFLLGFFVAGVVGRWWTLYRSIPWLNRISFCVNSFILGNGPMASRKVRLVVMRYMNLAWILFMRSTSIQIAKRFQHTKSDTNDDNEKEYSLREMFEAFNRDQKIRSTFKKIITDSEIKAFENIANKHFITKKTRYMPEYWVPMQWSTRVIQKAFIHGYICDPRTANGLLNEIETLRGQMHTLQTYCSNMIPLVYTQVVIIAVYSFFLCQLFSSQFIDPEDKREDKTRVDLYVPIFHICLFLFMMGWLKVALCVMNPFGDDDEDFQTSIMLDYNLDTTFRTAQSHNSSYPRHLHPLQVFYRKQDSHLSDSFHKFMDDVEMDLDDLEVFDHTERKKSFKSMNSLLKKFGVCCGKRTLKRRQRRGLMKSFYAPPKDDSANHQPANEQLKKRKFQVHEDV